MSTMCDMAGCDHSLTRLTPYHVSATRPCRAHWWFVRQPNTTKNKHVNFQHPCVRVRDGHGGIPRLCRKRFGLFVCFYVFCLFVVVSVIWTRDDGARRVRQ